MTRRAVVTGAAGFIGSHLCEALLDVGWSVVGIDAFTDTYAADRKRHNIAACVAHPAFDLVVADLCDADVRDVVERADAVLHLAGEPGVTGSWGASFDRYVARNITTTQRLLEACAAVGVGRLVYASSSSVLGDEHAGPASPYGVSKLAAEQLVGAYSQTGVVHGVALRYFTVYGPRQRPDMAFARFVDAALRGAPVTVYGDGHQTRDVTYVADVVAATVAAADAELRPGTVLDVGGGSPVSILAALDVLAELVGHAVDVRHRDVRPGEVRRTVASTARTEAALSWQPRVGIHEGLRRQLDARRDDLAGAGVTPAEVASLLR